MRADMERDLQPTGHFSLQRIDGPPDTDPRSVLLSDGRPTGTVVDGVVLEAAVAAGDETLLFATADIPFEEALHIHLLDNALKVVDSAWLGWMYSTGHFRDLRILDRRRLRFRFFGGTDWTLTLLERPGFRLPMVSEPRGVHRRFGFTRRFRIVGEPRPESSTRSFPSR